MCIRDSIHSNSWGAAVAGDYTVDSANADTFMWNNRDMVITFSAGNEGTDANSNGVIDNDSIGAPGTAKNVITVGASENARTDNYPCDTSLSYTTCASQSGANSIFTYGSAWPTDYPANPNQQRFIGRQRTANGGILQPRAHG